MRFNQFKERIEKMPARQDIKIIKNVEDCCNNYIIFVQLKKKNYTAFQHERSCKQQTYICSVFDKTTRMTKTCSAQNVINRLKWFFENMDGEPRKAKKVKKAKKTKKVKSIIPKPQTRLSYKGKYFSIVDIQGAVEKLHPMLLDELSNIVRQTNCLLKDYGQESKIEYFIRVDKRKVRRVLGWTHFEERMIRIMGGHVLFTDDEEGGMRQIETLIHEITHAILGRAHGHNRVFKARFRELLRRCGFEIENDDYNRYSQIIRRTEN